MFHRILVPVDGSASSVLAEEQTINISRKLGSEVTILHVVPTIYMLALQSYAKMPSDVTHEILRSLEHYGKSILNDAAHRFGEKGLKVDTKLMLGEQAEKILSTAEEGKYDLIVMGSLGEYVDGFFLETALERVVRLINRPILISKKRGEISKILVAVDGSEQSERAFIYAIHLADKLDSKVTLLHVVHSELFRFSKKAIESGEQILSNMASKAEGIELVKRIEMGHPAETIIKIADTEGFNLVAIGSKGLGAIKGFFIGSVSEKVIRHVQCSILITR